MPPRKKKQNFRTCVCGETWKTRDEFLRDKNVRILGYQPDFINHKYNHFLFQHRVKGCGDLFGIRASDFSDLREKECPNELCFGHDDCPGYCIDAFDLRVCSITCRNASDRKVASKIRSRRILRSLKSAAAKTKKSKKPKKRLAGVR